MLAYNPKTLRNYTVLSLPRHTMRGDSSKPHVARWLALLLLLLLTGCGREQPVEIGFVGPLSGGASDLGFAGRNGTLLAVEVFNNAGGLDGEPVTVVIRDDMHDAETGRKIVQELIDRKVAAIVGPMTSSVGVAVAPLANEAQKVMVSPPSTVITCPVI